MAAVLDDNSLRLVRIFDAPRERVFDAWADETQFVQWMCPPGVEITVCEIDVRPGGAWRIDGHHDGGRRVFASSGKYVEVKRPERLVFTNIAIDKEGNHLLEGETTVTFSEKGGKTTLILETHAVGLVPIAPQMLGGMEAGWTQSIDKLEELLER